MSGQVARGGRQPDITASGATEADWQSAVFEAAPPPVQWGSPGRVVVVAPHPDDEVLAVGGTMRQLAQRGFAVIIVAVTDGERAQPAASAAERRRLGATRSRERQRALASLGLGNLPVVRARLRDGAVSDGEELLTELLVALLHDDHPRVSTVVFERSWCLAPWRADGHPDHEAAGRAAAAASARCGSHLLEYPVWGWQWLRPEDPRFPWRDLRVEMLSGSTERTKEGALGAFVSQIAPFGSSPAPILSSGMLERFRRPFEGFLQTEGADEPHA